MMAGSPPAETLEQGVVGGEFMENVLMDVKTLCAYMGLTCAELAARANVDPVHLTNVMSGRARMLASELKALHEATGVPYQNIKTD